jgi:hypothetical protein
MALSKEAIEEDKSLDLIGEAGVHLFDVVPYVFPDHIVIRKLKEEMIKYKKVALARFWRDNGPWALLRAMKLYNYERENCRCNICREENPFHKVFCTFWEKFRWMMINSQITFVVVAAEDTESDLDNMVSLGGIPMVTVIENPQIIYPEPEGFNTLTLCEFMAPVSHIDVHIVFQRLGSELGITYGRKLWEKDDSLDEEIRKLDMLFARLRV